MRKDFIISAPKVAVGGTSFVGPWQTLVKFPATIPIPRPNGIGEDLTGASAKSDPDPLGIALAPHKRPQFVQFNDIMAAGRKNRAFERSQRLSFFLTNSKRCWDSPRRRAVNRVDCCVPDRLEGSFLFALRCISLWGFAALFTTIMAAVALFMVGRLAKFNDIFTSTVPTINNFSNHALKINCLTLFVQLKIQNNILFLYTTRLAPFGLRPHCATRCKTYNTKPTEILSLKVVAKMGSDQIRSITSSRRSGVSIVSMLVAFSRLRWEMTKAMV